MERNGTLKNQEAIQRSIIEDMSDGVLVLGLNGVISVINPAALAILEREEESLLGKPFARCFFDREENDEFSQAILDAVYERGKEHVNYVPFHTGTQIKQLRLLTTFLMEQDERVGVIAVISDLTELHELKDSLRAMERIQKLNQQLEVRNELLRATFGRYLSDDIVQEILEKPGGLTLGGQKREVTILMSDLRGFTAMCEHMEPQDVTASLNHYFHEMYEEISRYHGTLIEFLGDGLFIIFGAPLENPHHASDAVAAALGMQSRMEEVNRWNREHGYEPLSMGIGINTGPVILGNIGSDRRTKYGVMGANVNLTGRIESYTTAGEILISPSTRAAVPEELSVKREFPAQPKGVKEELTITQVVGIGAPYDRYITETEEVFTALLAPIAIPFRRIDGKHVAAQTETMQLLSLSENGAVCTGPEDIVLYENLVLDTGGELFAKVVKKQGNEMTLAFTAKPEGFAGWRERMLAGQEVKP